MKEYGKNRSILILAFIICIGFTLSPYYSSIFVSDHEHSLFDIGIYLFYCPHVLVYCVLDLVIPSIRSSGQELKVVFLFLSGLPASYLYAAIFIKLGRKVIEVLSDKTMKRNTL
jgi:hypothetical protein